MPSNSPLEALKAQALIARTHALFIKNVSKRHRKDGYDVCDGQHCQVYTVFAPRTSAPAPPSPPRAAASRFQRTARPRDLLVELRRLEPKRRRYRLGPCHLLGARERLARAIAPPASPSELRRYLSPGPTLSANPPATCIRPTRAGRA